MEKQMKILVTGSGGFIGKNVLAEFSKFVNFEILPYDLSNTYEELVSFINKADFIIHLAGINRPKDIEEFYKGNKGFTETIIDLVKETNRNIPILITSSIHADKDNPYGKSKKGAEDALLSFNQETGNTVYIYRLPNVFGKWCKPNYNSVVATFCYNIARDLPIQVNDENFLLPLVYIDDILEEFKNAVSSKANLNEDGYCYVEPTYTIKLGELVKLLYSFKDSRKDLSIPNMNDDLTKKLYATYLSYLPTLNFSYPLKMNIDNRGSFTEFLRTPERGQISVNVAKPGITKGNHWHHTKNEKFLVVSGVASIKFRNIYNEEIIEYIVSGEKLEVVDIPTGYTHSITNIGQDDLVTIMWANESYDPNKPDTFFLEVEKCKN